MSATGRTDDRLSGLRDAAVEAGAGFFLVTDIHNVSYLTGFTGSSGFVLASLDEAFFITDSRYESQAADEVGGFEFVIQQGMWTAEVASLLKRLGADRVCFESGSVSFDTYSGLAGALDGVELLPVKGAVEGLRITKNEDEIDRISRAVDRAERGFLENLSRVVPGMAEREAALGLEYNIRSEGAARVPFDIIVASGPRAALPHGIASGREMRDGETVVMDFGGEADGYQSDISRSGVLGRPNRKQTEVYEIVAEAQRRAIDAVRPGVPLREVDAAAREYIASKGYGDYFGHGLGHGVGLEVHEAPTVSPMSGDTARPGMVFTIEPGIYIPGWGGFRIEDMLLVTGDGCRLLTSLPREIRL